MNLYELRQKLERRKGKRDQISDDLKSTRETIRDLKKEIITSEKVQFILQTVAKETQEELEYRLSELVSLCLKSVFPDPYEFVVDFVIRRGKTECDLLFKRNNQLMKPVDASGIGVVDVAAFGLRVAAWSLSKPRTRSVLILDEPFKHLKGKETNKKVIQMVKALSEQLRLQIIMVSDERVPIEEIEKGADRIFEVTIKKGVSKVEVRR